MTNNLCEPKAVNKTGKILIVDDMPGMRLTLGEILEDEGYNVVVAEDGYQAIAAAREDHFDIIFMDIKMPGINGVQALREIKRLDPGVEVVMMTAYSVEELIDEARSENVLDVIYKPFDIEKILALVRASTGK